VSRLRLLALLPLLALLGGCDAVVLTPSGDIAAQQRDLLVESTLLMLLIIVPVIILVVIFAWRYRSSNKEARYEPEWDHSTHLELIIWAAPLLIIICLGALTWLGTHLLDPYRELGRIAEGRPVASNTQPLEVNVVALDWKWLFIYPQYGIASVNEMAAPVDRPIEFRITSSSVMNAFYVPALAGMVYAMPGMETKLHAVINEAGNFRGISANYSGAGFSGMRFDFKGESNGDFDAWVAGVKSASETLDTATYLDLVKPSENVPVRHFASVDPKLFDAVLNMCVEPGKMCESQMASIDAKGGLGMEGVRNVARIADNRAAAENGAPAPERTYVASLCTPADGGYGVGGKSIPVPADMSPLAGAGLLPPGMAVGAPPTNSTASIGLKAVSPRS
jgi:cytochrome o ubiquinol oxidase subunit 2